jgi:methylmalonyl-CoA/ethylmalonyl-CoA epimerase
VITRRKFVCYFKLDFNQTLNNGKNRTYGIAVKDLDVSNLIFEKLFGTPAHKSEEVESEKVSTSRFFKKRTKIELWQLQAQSPIAKFIDKRRGIHHIAFAVEDIVSEIAFAEGRVCRLE